MKDRFELFVTYINQIYRSVQKIKSKEMTEMGLKGTHVMCLFSLGQHPEGLTAAELSTYCMEDKAAVSRAVAKLETEGLIALDIPKTQRRYRTKIILTNKGKKITDKMMQLISMAVTKGGEGLSEQDRETFYRALGVISNNLQNLYTDKEN